MFSEPITDDPRREADRVILLTGSSEDGPSPQPCSCTNCMSLRCLTIRCWDSEFKCNPKERVLTPPSIRNLSLSHVLWNWRKLLHSKSICAMEVSTARTAGLGRNSIAGVVSCRPRSAMFVSDAAVPKEVAAKTNITLH